MTTQDFISLGAWEIFAVLANTLVLYFILKKLFFTKVAKMITDRETEVQSLYKVAEDAKSNALALEEEYTSRIASAKSESAEIMKTTTLKASKKTEEMLKDAREQASIVMQKAEANAVLEMKKAKNQLKDEISEIAMQIATKAIEKEVKSSDHTRLIEDFIKSEGATV